MSQPPPDPYDGYTADLDDEDDDYAPPPPHWGGEARRPQQDQAPYDQFADRPLATSVQRAAGGGRAPGRRRRQPAPPPPALPPSWQGAAKAGAGVIAAILVGFAGLSASNAGDAVDRMNDTVASTSDQCQSVGDAIDSEDAETDVMARDLKKIKKGMAGDGAASVPAPPPVPRPTAQPTRQHQATPGGKGQRPDGGKTGKQERAKGGGQ